MVDNQDAPVMGRVKYFLIIIGTSTPSYLQQLFNQVWLFTKAMLAAQA